jgi:hypothetical protein
VLIGDQLTPARLAALGMIVASVAFVLIRPFRRNAA